jgi:ABC-type glycerol-3-phosphate transport system permease component
VSRRTLFRLGTLAASTLASLPVLIFFIVLQRHFVNGLMAGSFNA